MTRSRWVVLGSAVVVTVGALVAMGAIYLSPARAAVGPMPAEGLILPADTRFVVGLDVRRFVQSELYTTNRRTMRPESSGSWKRRPASTPRGTWTRWSSPAGLPWPAAGASPAWSW
jgi:hypothetical protein